MFIDEGNYNYSYSENSPCIDAGDPSQYDSDGSIRDIGANIFLDQLLGDCNQDEELNVIDLIYNINNCVMEIVLPNCNCTDINQDNEYNVLDIVSIVNIILLD